MARRPAYDVVVVGGGIVGLACAYRLAVAGARVAVVERERPGGGASGAAAGILAPGHEGAGDPVLRDLALRSYRLWPAFAAEVEAAAGIATGFVERGEALLAEDDAAAEALRARAGDGPGAPRWLEPAELPPCLRAFRVAGALLHPLGAHLEPPATVQALAAAFAARGTLLEGAEVLDLAVHRGRGRRRVEAVVTQAGPLTAGTVVLAAGAFAGGLAARLGVSLPVVPVKGQILAVRTPPALRDWQEGLLPVFATSSVYMVPKRDGRTVIGATEEWDGGFDRAVTLGGLAWLASRAAALLPELAGAPLVTTWAGLRPGTPDRRPVLGPLPGYANVLVAGGHFRNGILLAPLTAQVIADLVAGRRPEVDLEPLDPGRFARLGDRAGGRERGAVAGGGTRRAAAGGPSAD